MKYFFGGIIIALLGLGVFFWNFSSKNNSADFLQAIKGENVDASPVVTKKYTEIANPSGFVNTNNISIGENIGKNVVLVDFLTYSCINCIRTFPYLNAWYDKYHDAGLQIIGIHTPEFAFEHKKENVVAAMQKFGIKFPIVLDNDYGTWRAYQNSYWPRKYLIDINGSIVYDHIGEGGYDETEKKIQDLLQERNKKLGITMNVDTERSNPKDIMDLGSGIKSPETYFGADRSPGLGNGRIQVGKDQIFVAPKTTILNTPYLAGTWNFVSEYAETKAANAKIFFRYSAKRIFFVASSPQENTVKVIQDGKFVKEIKIKNDQLYTLIENDVSGEHNLELQVTNPGLKAFTFTFG